MQQRPHYAIALNVAWRTEERPTGAYVVGLRAPCLWARKGSMMRFTASQFISTCLAAGFACGLAPAWAASATDSLYQQERQRCLDGSTQQDQRTCLQEAKAARDQMRRGLLQTEATATLAANAVLRCQVHKVDADRQACVRMARGEGEVSGSVAAGGVIRADTTVTVGSVPAAPPPASSPR